MRPTRNVDSRPPLPCAECSRKQGTRQQSSCRKLGSGRRRGPRPGAPSPAGCPFPPASSGPARQALAGPGRPPPEEAAGEGSARKWQPLPGPSPAQESLSSKHRLRAQRDLGLGRGRQESHARGEGVRPKPLGLLGTCPHPTRPKTPGAPLGSGRPSGQSSGSGSLWGPEAEGRPGGRVSGSAWGQGAEPFSR